MDTIKNRDELYSAFYTFVRVWKDAERPQLMETNHRQRNWQKIVGGIMNHAADVLDCDYYTCHGENYAIHKQNSDPEWMDMSTLVKAIANNRGTERWTINDIMTMASYKVIRTEDGVQEVGR